MCAALLPKRWHDSQEDTAGNRSPNTEPTPESGTPAPQRTVQRIRLDLTKCSEGQNSEVREAAAYALSKLGEHAASAVPALTKCLADESSYVRRGGS